MCKITEVSGDLFAAPRDYSLAHCVSVDLRMGKGIAVKFRDTFGRVPKLQLQNPKVGGVVLLKDGNRYIYYLVTKKLVYNKPTYQSLLDSLKAMREHMHRNGVTQLAIPRLGCGLDGLLWAKVKTQIREVFQEDDVEIVVYNYCP